MNRRLTIHVLVAVLFLPLAANADSILLNSREFHSAEYRGSGTGIDPYGRSVLILMPTLRLYRRRR
jgi:hypothetical protein